VTQLDANVQFPPVAFAATRSCCTKYPEYDPTVFVGDAKVVPGPVVVAEHKVVATVEFGEAVGAA
jgi:hypothetical protein